MGDNDMYNASSPKNRYVRIAVLKPASVAVFGVLALSACSPGGVVAGTIGAAGAVAGAGVDLVLRQNMAPGELE